MITKWKTEGGTLTLLDGDFDRVLSITKEEDGQVTFMEGCDDYYFVTMTKDEARVALREALEWLDRD